MPVRIGFAQQRRQLLEAELARVTSEIGNYGIERAFLTGDFALGKVMPSTELELVIVQRTDCAFVERSDFFSSHLSQRIGMHTYVYTPDEFEQCAQSNPVIRRALSIGEEIFSV